jgi:hypothetical protein
MRGGGRDGGIGVLLLGARLAGRATAVGGRVLVATDEW